MAIGLPLTCLVALTVLGKVDGFLGQEIDSETLSQSKDVFNISQENRMDLQERKGACKNIGGKCIHKKKDCPNGFPLQTNPGGPYCSKRNRCCYPGCVYGLETYPNNAIIKQGCFELHCEMGYWIISSDDCLETFYSNSFFVTVKTGHGLDAGTDANVHIVFEDHNGKSTKKFPISHQSRGHLKRDGNDEHRVPIPKDFGKTTTLKISLESKDRTIKDWFCDHIFVEDPRDNTTLYFPIHRRIESSLKYEFSNDDGCIIPKDGPSNPILKEYEFNYDFTAALVKTLPRDEHFSPIYAVEFGYEFIKSDVEQAPRLLKWELTGKIMDIYYGYFHLPESFHIWSEDAWFGAQRVQGLVPNIIQLCSKIPDNLGVTEDTVEGLLEGLTLQQALENNRIFITDLNILYGIQYKDTDIDHAAPIALFYLNKINQLMPIAIQLWQKKGPNNPVYTPKDPPITWIVAKMYYNNAEAQVHEIVEHFCYTHLIMDGIATSMNRQLPPDHPVYKLLKPHFLFMMAINKKAEGTLFGPGGKLDLFSVGTVGAKKLNAKAVPLFTFETAIGNVESDATIRRVWDKNILPYYPFRDDASAIYNITKKYVTTILNNCYDNKPQSVEEDKLLQNYRKELNKTRDEYGVGIIGLPGSNTTGFSYIAEVIDMVTVFIVQCSVGHAAVNFPQYETYGWMPNYPANINEAPPHQKVNYKEEDIMKLLPDKANYLHTMGLAKLLSWDGTNELGDYEKVYFTDPVSIAALEEFKEDLKELSQEIQKRNQDMKFPYKYLDPEFVPNAISI